MKTSELTGPALDWAVAKCEGHTIGAYENRKGALVCRDRYGKVRFIKAGRGSCIDVLNCGYWSPSTDWSQGGPIIERESIGLSIDGDDRGWEWEASDIWENKYKYFGPTPLIAAMRCYVTLKLGDEVDIPEELK